MTRTTQPDAASTGFVLVAVLVITGLIVSLAATYSHHVLAGERSSLASPDALRAREICNSHLEVARRAVLTGSAVQGQIVEPDGATTSLTVQPTASDTRSILVETLLPSGERASKLVSAVIVPDPSSTPGDANALPHWPDALIAAINADSGIPKLHYTADTVLSGVDLQGLLVVHDGVRLTLSDVVLNGAIVSEQALVEGDFAPYDALQAPELVVAGNLRIDALSGVPSVSILMPDGLVSSSGSSTRVQLAGDVVAHSVSLVTPGFLGGHVSSVMTSSLSPSLDLIGSERKPQAWSSELEYGDVWSTSAVSVTPEASSIAALSAITDYWSSH